MFRFIMLFALNSFIFYSIIIQFNLLFGKSIRDEVVDLHVVWGPWHFPVFDLIKETTNFYYSKTVY